MCAHEQRHWREEERVTSPKLAVLVSFVSRPEGNAQPRPAGAEDVASVAQGSCRPTCPSFLRAGRLTDTGFLQTSDGVFVSNVGLLVFPSAPSSDIKILSSCVGACAFPTQVASFPFTVHARCLGEWVAGVRSEPWASMSSRCCCPPGAGCWVSGIGNLGTCTQQVCWKFGKLQKKKKKKPQA